MPNIPSSSVTFAFSNRYNSWTTRYSFTPTCYANCGDIMLSSKDNSGVWRHDVNVKRNNFYGEQFSSKADITFNDYPSEVKVYKALSVETNQDLWYGSFKTHEENSNRNNQETYPFASTLNDKEGIKYIEVPRSIKNSTANISPFPRVNTDDIEAFDIAVNAATATNTFEIFLTAQDFQLVDSASFSLSSGLNYSEILIKSGSTLIGFSDFISQNTQYSLLSSINFIGGTNKAIVVDSIDNYSVRFTSSRPPGLSTTFDLFIEALKEFLSADQLFVKSSARINGDQMRGPYLNVSLSQVGSNPLEIFSFNVDYELSSSATRLTQFSTSPERLTQNS